MDSLIKALRFFFSSSSFVLASSTTLSGMDEVGKFDRYPPLISIAPGAIPVALLEVLRYEISRSLTASLIGLSVPRAVFTAFPNGFIKHSASLA
jgi:hypothetical protein